MTCVNDNKMQRRLSAKLAAGLALSAFLVLGTLVASASAQERNDPRTWNENSRTWNDPRTWNENSRTWNENGNQYGWDHRGERGYNDWERRHYHRTPPVVYGSPYYYPPPVIYEPDFGLNVPGLSIHIR
ncbi:MAG: hypothetical protein WCF85_13845 [Rhodospirillaceae bacterium]